MEIDFNGKVKNIKIKRPKISGGCIAYPVKHTENSKVRWIVYIFSGFIINMVYLVITCYMVYRYKLNNVFIIPMFYVSIFILIDSIVYRPNSNMLNDFTIAIGTILNKKWVEVLYESELFFGQVFQGKRPREINYKFYRVELLEDLDSIVIKRKALICLLFIYLDKKLYKYCNDIIEKILFTYKEGEQIPSEIYSLNLFLMSYCEKDYEKAEELFSKVLSYTDSIERSFN